MTKRPTVDAETDRGPERKSLYAGPLRRRDDQRGAPGAGDTLEGLTEEYAGHGAHAGRPSDETLQEEICELLLHRPDVDADRIEVLVEGGEVTLHGAVAGPDARWLVEELVASVSGVSLVHNRVRVARK